MKIFVRVFCMLLCTFLIGAAYGRSVYFSDMFVYIGDEDDYEGETSYDDEEEYDYDDEEPLAPVVSDVQLQDVLDVAFSFLGVPYVFGGSSMRGMDCSGFVCSVYSQACGMQLPRSAHDIYLYAQNMSDVDFLSPGDLVFFSASGTRVSHVGIYLGDEQFIHSASDGPKTGVIVSNLGESYWNRTFVGGGTVL